MRVISLKLLREFWDRYADAEQPLRHWYKTVVGASWRDVQDVKQTYAHADAVRTTRGETLTVFNVRGNKYRLIARIRYDYRLVNIRHVLTHEEYDEGKWKE